MSEHIMRITRNIYYQYIIDLGALAEFLNNIEFEINKTTFF